MVVVVVIAVAVVIIVVLSSHPFLRFLSVLLHMLRQVCFLSVWFSTKVTNMSLQMLRFLVFGYVIEKWSLIRKAFVARVAFVRLVSLMTSGMRLKVRQLRKCLVTTWMSTFIRLVTRMRSYMLLQMGKLRELPLTNLTPVRLDSW